LLDELDFRRCHLFIHFLLLLRGLIFSLDLFGCDHALQVLDGLPFAVWGKT
jgi:hypothetical protein